jgi:hypothetical protein
MKTERHLRHADRLKHFSREDGKTSETSFQMQISATSHQGPGFQGRYLVVAAVGQTWFVKVENVVVPSWQFLAAMVVITGVNMALYNINAKETLRDPGQGLSVRTIMPC